jgi:hypothetical protein
VPRYAALDHELAIPWLYRGGCIMSANPTGPQRKSANQPVQTQSALSSWLLLGGIGIGVLVLLVTGVVVGLALEGTRNTAEAESVSQRDEAVPDQPATPIPVEKAAPSKTATEDVAPPSEGPELIAAPAPIVEDKRPVGVPAPARPDPDPAQPAVPDMAPRGPKRLTSTIKLGLEYLARTQLANGGWPTAAAVPMAAFPGFRPGVVQPQQKPPVEQADLGPTCIATLALLRAGNTPTEGPYAKNVAKAVEFILFKVDRSDSRSLVINDLKQTQLQHKIGPYVDTFLALMVLAELKGRTGSDKTDQRVAQALQKTITKIEGNVKADGTFANNNGWASVLSQGLAIKGLNRARQAGAKVSDAALDRLQKHALAELDQKLKAGKPAAGVARPGKGPMPPVASSDAGAPSDAGVALYSLSANLAGLREAVTTNQEREDKARSILADDNASNEQKARAKSELARLQESRKALDRAVDAVVAQAQDKTFVRGFGSNGGEEFLSFMNISETLLLKGGGDWEKWEKSMASSIEEVQDKDGCWSGHHCITGKTFCTATALLTLMADRSQLTVVGSSADKK